MRDYSSQAIKFRQKVPKHANAALALTLFIILTGSFAAGLIWLNQSSEIEATEIPKPVPALVHLPDTPNITDKKLLKPIAENISRATEDFYTFYDLLLKNEVPIDVEAGKTRDEVLADKLKTTLIQVASFKSAQVAESERVKLLFLNLKARVIAPSEADGEWYRIMVGPFKTFRDMNAAMDLLTKNGHRPQQRKE